MKTMLERSNLITDKIVAFRRDFHRYPELSLQEERTAGIVADELRRLGLAVRTSVGGHGVVADLAGGKPGTRIALRADMDALPIQEALESPFKSLHPGVMHACGHDAHTACLLGAAHILAGMREQLAGHVRFIFQAAEEINAGARAMINEGVLEGVDEIFGLHNLPTLSAGKAAVRHGALMGSVDRIDITVVGKGAHGAIPDQGIDPIVASSAMIMGLQTAVSRELSPFEPAVVTIGSIHAGEASNVIPNEARLSGTIRTFSAATHQVIPEIVERLVQQICSAYRCTATVTYTRQTPVLENGRSSTDYVKEVFDRVLGHENHEEAQPTMAGEDFSLYLQLVPGSFFWLGSGPLEGAEHAYGLHHPKFNLNESCLPLGAALLAEVAAGRLS